MTVDITKHDGLIVRKYSEPFITNSGENLGHPVLIRTIADADVWRMISKDAGIYHLFSNGELVYIGVSKNLQSRLRNHYDSEKLFDAYLLFPCSVLPISTLYRIEAEMIAQYRPTLNQTWN